MKRLLIGLVVILTTISLSSCEMITNFIPTQTPYPTYTPNPTFTPYPTFTPRPTPTVATSTPEPSVLYQENDFGGFDSCFEETNLSGGKFYAENGLYHVAVERSHWYLYSTCEKSFRDFILDVDATIVSGPDDTGYGVFFRKDGSGGFYSFMISADGYYSMQERYPEDNRIFVVLGWAPLKDVEQGRRTNHLRVIAVEDQLELYVNGSFVGLLHQSSLRSGTFGFIVETYDEKDSVVAFDNLKITEP